MKNKPWTITNGVVEMDVCTNCAQPYRSGHVDCTCPQNHKERCERPGYEDLTDILEHVMPVYDLYEYPRDPEEILANACRVSRDNADIAVKAMGMLAECQQGLEDLVIPASSVLIKIPQDEHWIRLGDALDAAGKLLAKQKEMKLYD